MFFPDGRPVSGATVLVDQNSDTGCYFEVPPVTATTAADGSFKLTGLATRAAGQNHTVYALWFDENADGNADYGTTQVNVPTYPATIARAFLTYNAIGQRVVASNVLDGELPPNEDISFTFAMPVLTTNLNQAQANAYVLTNLTRNTVVPVDPTWTGNTQLALKPSVGALREGERYSIALQLTTAGQAGSGSGTNTTFNTTFNFQLRGTTITPMTDQVTGLTVINPYPGARQTQATFDFDTNYFRVQWDGVQKAVKYFIYAKDTSLNPNFVQIAGPIGFVGSGTQRYVQDVSLPASFMASGQGGTTFPLAYNNRVTFTVIGQDTYGNLAPVSGAPTATVQDNWAPQVLGGGNGMALVYPTATAPDAINDGTDSTNIVFRLYYNEPMDPQTKPDFTFPAGASTSFVWDGFTSGSQYTGTLTVTIPAGTDATGAFTIRGGKDMAGNLLSSQDLTGSLGGRKELVTNGGFEDASGNCSMTGWQGQQNNSATAPNAVAGNARTGKCALQLGTPVTMAGTTGYSRAYQDINLPSTTNTNWYFNIGIGYMFRYAGSSAGSPAVSQICRLESTSSVLFFGLLGGSSSNSYVMNYSTWGNYYAGTFAPATTVRMTCEVNNPSTTVIASGSMYLDDVSFQLVKPAVGGLYTYGP